MLGKRGQVARCVTGVQGHTNPWRLSPWRKGHMDYDGRKGVADFRPIEKALIHQWLPGLLFFCKEQIGVGESPRSVLGKFFALSIPT